MDTDSQQKRTDESEFLRKMREDILEDRYPDLDSAKRLLGDAGHDKVRVNVPSSDARTMWTQLFSQMDKLGVLDDVLLVIADEAGPKWGPPIRALVAGRRQESENEPSESRRADTIWTLDHVMDMVGRLISHGRTLRHPMNPSRGSLASLQQDIRALFAAVDNARGNERLPRADEYAWLDDIENRVMEIADSLQIYLYTLRRSGLVGRPLPSAAQDALPVSGAAEDDYEYTLTSAKASLRQRLLQLSDTQRPD